MPGTFLRTHRDGPVVVAASEPAHRTMEYLCLEYLMARKLFDPKKALESFALIRKLIEDENDNYRKRNKCEIAKGEVFQRFTLPLVHDRMNLFREANDASEKANQPEEVEPELSQDERVR